MNDSPFNTPMMRQYLELKKKHNDCILFFRLGDFYEMFMDDAKLGAQILDITLTSRDRGKDGRVPMCGVPYHAVDSYLPKLVRAGYKVAICEQIGDVNGPGLVERAVVRIVTPGTLLNEASLDGKENNFIMSLATEVDSDHFAVAIADVSTGLFYTAQYKTKFLESFIVNELSKFNLTECILPDNLYNDAYLLKLLKTQRGINIFPFFDWNSFAGSAPKFLKDHFGTASLDNFGIANEPFSQISSAVLLGYLKHTQKADLTHIKKIQHLKQQNFMHLDRATILNLELFSTMREGLKKGSLINFLDRTVTSMGGRMLKSWILHPLLNSAQIEERYDVLDFFKNAEAKEFFLKNLEKIWDIERILSRLAVGLGNPRDLINLKESLSNIGNIKDLIKKYKNDLKLLQKFYTNIDEKVLDLVGYLTIHVDTEPPLDPRNGGFINKGVNNDLDLLRKKIKNSKTFIEKLEQNEKKRSGINSLKVKFNQVFGYYIEISKANLHNVPKDYYRKQTLVNAERFITPELKEHEEIILTAEEKLKDIEYEIFLSIVAHVLEYTQLIQNAADTVAQLDCLISLQTISEENNFVRPTLTTDGKINITEGRHPVVESVIPKGEFIPNDTYISNEENQLIILTGPNMGGKSVFIRQVALIVLLAQMGCYVPAKSAEVSIVDKIFVRSGAADTITGGLSTFMVEMVETAYILNNATNDSLIIMDEIGRGTSTYDGISIAWAVAEFFVKNGDVRPKTLFATHYHELQQLENKYSPRIKNFQVLVDNSGENPVFLHKVVSGGAAHSFGIHVAKNAGVPYGVYSRAEEILAELKDRAGESKDIVASHEPSLDLVEVRNLELLSEKMRDVDISATTPLEALNILAEIKKIWDRS